MKKIINGKKYDTETAKGIGVAESAVPRSNFSHWHEELFRKKTGEYFLWGEGGAASKYAENCGQNTWCWGEDITPLTKKEAMKWCENHLSVEDYEAEFGEVPE